MENQDQNSKSIQDLLNTRGINGGFNDQRIRRSRDFKFYGITQGRSGKPETSLAIKVIMSNGEQIVIQYHDLLSPIKFDGGSKIELSTSMIHLVIEGTGMDKILDYLAEHRLMWIKEPESSADIFDNFSDSEEIQIESIAVNRSH